MLLKNHGLMILERALRIMHAYHDLELALHLLDLVLGLDEVLAVQVAVCPHRLIQILLLLQPCLAFYNLQGIKRDPVSYTSPFCESMDSHFPCECQSVT